MHHYDASHYHNACIKIFDRFSFRWLQLFIENIHGKIIAKKNMSNQSQKRKLDVQLEIERRLKFLEKDTENVCTLVIQINNIYYVNCFRYKLVWKNHMILSTLFNWKSSYFIASKLNWIPIAWLCSFIKLTSLFFINYNYFMVWWYWFDSQSLLWGIYCILKCR